MNVDEDVRKRYIKLLCDNGFEKDAANKDLEVLQNQGLVTEQGFKYLTGIPADSPCWRRLLDEGLSCGCMVLLVKPSNDPWPYYPTTSTLSDEFKYQTEVKIHRDRCLEYRVQSAKILCGIKEFIKLMASEQSKPGFNIKAIFGGLTGLTQHDGSGTYQDFNNTMTPTKLSQERVDYLWQLYKKRYGGDLLLRQVQEVVSDSTADDGQVRVQYGNSHEQGVNK